MSAITLNVRRFPNDSAPSLIILHGLLGSSRNWISTGKAMASDFDIHALDLRNHGGSPHSEFMNWTDLTDDLLKYIDTAELDEILLMGHSIGGKAAMRFACDNPNRVRKLIVIDIAAKDYPKNRHSDELEAMLHLPIESIKNRKEADLILAESIKDLPKRQFLLTNLARDDQGGYHWQLNLPTLNRYLPVLSGNSMLEGACFNGPSLLIVGGNSNYVIDEDIKSMRTWLPNLNTKTLKRAGHNVHIDNPDTFRGVIGTFLN
jgi:esterase